MNVARIDDEIITTEDFIKILKFDNAFNDLIERIVISKLTVHAAKKIGIDVSAEDVQSRVDQFRRVEGLHRAQDTHRFLDNLGVSTDEFEQHIAETLYREKMVEQVATPSAIEEYFRLHSPRFDSIELSHIMVDSENKARELLAVLEDEPDLFAELVSEHSLDEETKNKGGSIGKIARGALAKDIEAKLFNANVDEFLGPFTSDGELFFEIYRVDAKHPAKLNDKTRQSVAKLVFDEWIRARSQEHVLEVV